MVLGIPSFRRISYIVFAAIDHFLILHIKMTHTIANCSRCKRMMFDRLNSQPYKKTSPPASLTNPKSTFTGLRLPTILSQLSLKLISNGIHNPSFCRQEKPKLLEQTSLSTKQISDLRRMGFGRISDNPWKPMDFYLNFHP